MKELSNVANKVLVHAHAGSIRAVPSLFLRILPQPIHYRCFCKMSENRVTKRVLPRRIEIRVQA